MVEQMVGHLPPKHTYQKREYYYFKRRVPVDLLSEYRKPVIVIALKTRDRTEAKERSEAISLQLESLWRDMRLQSKTIPAKHLLHSVAAKAAAPKLTEAKRIYIKLKGTNKSRTFHQDISSIKGREPSIQILPYLFQFI